MCGVLEHDGGDDDMETGDDDDCKGEAPVEEGTVATSVATTGMGGDNGVAD